MTRQELKSRIDKLWEAFWTGGITNPLSVIEQITFLMFARMLDMRESTNEKAKSRIADYKYDALFTPEQQDVRWSHFKNLSGQELLLHVRDKVFPSFRSMSYEGATFGEYMKNAQLLVQKPSLLETAIEMIDSLPLTKTDIKGDIYEYLLSKLTTAGINGQFRTPRHIIHFMCELSDPTPEDRICDPACGTAGFLVGAHKYLLEKYTSESGVFEDEDGTHYTGDMLKEHQKQYIQNEMFHGFDFDDTMLRVASMNMLLHGVDAPAIHYQDTLGTSFEDRYPDDATEGFDLILANPPFKGSLDYDDAQTRLIARAKTKKTELLFLLLILEMLKPGGRAAVIVPDGVLFGSSKAHKAVREMLVEENGLEAVISLPSGVFKPYAGVSTAILLFRKGSETKDVFFYDLQADGFSLDDKRNAVEENDLPTALEAWRGREGADLSDRTQKAFMVPKDDLKANAYDLSLSRYKEVVYEEEDYDPPKEILGRLKGLQKDIDKDIIELEEMLG